MDEKTYLEKRVQDQMAWFERKSALNQKRYKRLKTTALVLSVSLPFLAAINPFRNVWDQWLIGVIGIVIAVVEGLLSLNKYQENWVQYRATAEALKQEQNLYLTKSGIYLNSETPFNDFVLSVENILGGENKKWQKYASQEVKVRKK